MWFSLLSLQILFVSRAGWGGELEDVTSQQKRRLEAAPQITEPCAGRRGSVETCFTLSGLAPSWGERTGQEWEMCGAFGPSASWVSWRFLFLGTPTTPWGGWKGGSLVVLKHARKFFDNPPAEKWGLCSLPLMLRESLWPWVTSEALMEEVRQLCPLLSEPSLWQLPCQKSGF